LFGRFVFLPVPNKFVIKENVEDREIFPAVTGKTTITKNKSGTTNARSPSC
jgi:hypothetical protein